MVGGDDRQHADDHFYGGGDLCSHLLSEVGYEVLPLAVRVDSVEVVFPRPCPVPHASASTATLDEYAARLWNGGFRSQSEKET